MTSSKNISGVAVENAPNEKAYWYVLRVSYHREQRAFEWLTSQGLEVYLPLHFVKKEVDSKTKRVQEPLLPSLVFAHSQLSKLDTLMKSDKNGDSVIITDGPFKEIKGRVDRVNSQQRVVVEMEGIGCVTTAYVPSGFIKRIN